MLTDTVTLYFILYLNKVLTCKLLICITLTVFSRHGSHQFHIKIYKFIKARAVGHFVYKLMA